MLLKMAVFRTYQDLQKVLKKYFKENKIKNHLNLRSPFEELAKEYERIFNERVEQVTGSKVGSGNRKPISDKVFSSEEAEQNFLAQIEEKRARDLSPDQKIRKDGKVFSFRLPEDYEDVFLVMDSRKRTELIRSAVMSAIDNCKNLSDNFLSESDLMATAKNEVEKQKFKNALKVANAIAKIK